MGMLIQLSVSFDGSLVVKRLAGMEAKGKGGNFQYPSTDRW